MRNKLLEGTKHYRFADYRGGRVSTQQYLLNHEVQTVHMNFGRSVSFLLKISLPVELNSLSPVATNSFPNKGDDRNTKSKEIVLFY
jgi:hypothetical protein